MDSELHIVVPGICGPLAETHSIQDSLVLKNWVSVLAKSNRTSSASNVYDVTRSILNLSIEGDFPSAALSLLANNLYDDALFYMHADPVHFARPGPQMASDLRCLGRRPRRPRSNSQRSW